MIINLTFILSLCLPIETIKNNRNIYGWVFGGYLTDKLEPVKLCSQLSRKRICSSLSIGISDKACMAKNAPILFAIIITDLQSLKTESKYGENSFFAFRCSYYVLQFSDFNSGMFLKCFVLFVTKVKSL